MYYVSMFSFVYNCNLFCAHFFVPVYKLKVDCLWIWLLIGLSARSPFTLWLMLTSQYVAVTTVRLGLERSNVPPSLKFLLKRRKIVSQISWCCTSNTVPFILLRFCLHFSHTKTNCDGLCCWNGFSITVFSVHVETLDLDSLNSTIMNR